MAVKTITIDIAAYDLLSRHKRPGQSFSEVIKERLGGTSTAADLLRLMPDAHLSADTLDVVERVVARRRRDYARAPKL
jgi:predicted CopG family antitoxin